jgi:cytochrome P450
VVRTALTTSTDHENRLSEELRFAVRGGLAAREVGVQRHGPPSTESLARLQYVDWVVKETLRLYPTSWVIAREAIETCSIGPSRVAPGTGHGDCHSP